MSKYFSIIILYVIISYNASYSQTLSEKRIAEDMIFFLMNVDWPSKVLNKEVFTIGVLDKDEAFSTYLRSILDDAKIHDLPVDVFHFAKSDNVFPCHVLIVSKSRNRDIDKVYENIKRDYILLVTERGKDEEYQMIDYKDASRGEFSIYVEHIESAGLKISDEFKAYALGDITLQELYYQSRSDLTTERETVKGQHNILRTRRDELDSLTKEINQKNLILRDKQLEIDIQTDRLRSLSNRLRTQQFVIVLSSLTLLFLSLTLFLLYKNFSLKMETNIKLKAKNDAINKQKQEIEQKNIQITDSMNYAKRIQGAILISEGELIKTFKEAFVFYVPREIVSGDFYWFSKLNNGCILASIDCTGHGVPGAFMSMIGNTLLNQIVKTEGCSNPAEVLTYLHHGIIELLNNNGNDSDVQDGMDASVLYIPDNLNKVIFSGAIQSVYLVRGNQLEVISGDKTPIGDKYLAESVLNKGDSLYTNHEFDGRNTNIYLITDGFVDQFGGTENKKYNIPKLKQFLLDIQHKPMRKQKELFQNEFNDWKSTQPQTDDVTVLGLRLE